MRLNQLLKHLTYEHVQGSQSREITDICYHSGNVREGSLFVCLKGLHTDGHDYLQGALEAGRQQLWLRRRMWFRWTMMRFCTRNSLVCGSRRS